MERATKNDNNFHLIRLIAAFQVMLSHSIIHFHLPIAGPLLKIIELFPGVPIFFVVSGYLISGSFIYSGKSTSEYFESRALRIYPALWVNILAIVCILLPIGQSLSASPTSFGFWRWLSVALPLGSDYTADHLIGPIFQNGGHYPFFPSGVLWTIPVELSFYILVPIIFFRKRWYAASIAAWIVASLACFALIERAGFYQIFIGLYLWIFLLGAAMRVFWDRIKWALEGTGWLWLIAYLLAAHGGWRYTNQLVSTVALMSLLACAVISCAFTVRRLSSRMLGNNDVSYGLYLWHMPVIATAMAWWQQSWLVAIACWITAIAIAWFSWRLLEKPALNQKGRFLSAGRALYNHKARRIVGDGTRRDATKFANDPGV